MTSITQPACTLDSNGRVLSGNRIKNLKFNGQLVKDSDVFTVAINNYRYNGGGGFMAAAGISNTDVSLVTYDSAKVLGDDGQVRSLMMKYVQDNKTITPSLANNWRIVTFSSPIVQDLQIEKISTETEFMVGQDAKVVIRATNNSKEAKDVTLIIALFDKEGRLINYVSEYQNIAMGKTADISGTIKVLADCTVVKGFVWDTLEGMKPLSNVITLPIK